MEFSNRKNLFCALAIYLDTYAISVYLLNNQING
jgi:FtsH-binding integral membrane protein